MRFFGIIVLAALLAPAGAGAQQTPWGDPDLQGVWTNQTPVPLERPDGLAHKPHFTTEEAAEFERTALTRILALVEPEIPVSGELNAIWLETQDGKVTHNLRTSQIVDPPDGKIPFTTEGRARWEAVPTLERMLAGHDLDASVPEDRTFDERCITAGGLFFPNPFYNNYHQIFQAPGYVVIVSEMMHETRIIPLDRRPHVGPGIAQWLGDSRGWWDGDTLVVETARFNGKGHIRGATQHLRMVERFARLDNNAIAYQLTLTDPQTFTRRWTIENTLRRSDNAVYEVACHEGNYGLANILSAARHEESEATEAPSEPLIQIRH